MNSSYPSDVNLSLSSMIVVFFFSLYRWLCSWFVCQAEISSSIHINSLILYSTISPMEQSHWSVVKFKSSPEWSTGECAMVFHCWVLMIGSAFLKYWIAFNKWFPKCEFLLYLNFPFVLFIVLSVFLHVLNTLTMSNNISHIFLELFR
jgi:hypothetical protein